MKKIKDDKICRVHGWAEDEILDFFFDSQLAFSSNLTSNLTSLTSEQFIGFFQVLTVNIKNLHKLIDKSDH